MINIIKKTFKKISDISLVYRQYIRDIHLSDIFVNISYTSLIYLQYFGMLPPLLHMSLHARFFG